METQIHVHIHNFKMRKKKMKMLMCGIFSTGTANSGVLEKWYQHVLTSRYRMRRHRYTFCFSNPYLCGKWGAKSNTRTGVETQRWFVTYEEVRIWIIVHQRAQRKKWDTMQQISARSDSFWFCCVRKSTETLNPSGWNSGNIYEKTLLEAIKKTNPAITHCYFSFNHDNNILYS